MKPAIFQRRGGFTLLEILVVAAIMGVVMTLGTSAFVGVTRAWNERRAITDLDDQARAAFESIRLDVESAISPELSGVVPGGASRTVSDDRSYPAATYADDELVLAVEGVDTRGSATPMKVAYRVERNGATGILMRTAGGLSSEMVAGAPLEVIPAKVQGFSVEYLGRGPGAAWSETWAGPGSPAALRVSLALEHPVRSEFQLARKAVFAVHVE